MLMFRYSWQIILHERNPMTTSTAQSIGGESHAAYLDAVELVGKTVLVALGTSGINLGIAEDFARAGARVAVLSR